MVKVQRLPLFPLQTVLFPRLPLPLHIFELRYRRMIRRCMETREEFGIILHRGTEISKTGCAALVEGIIQEYDDGRFDVLTIGQERFRVRRFFEEKSYLEAEVEFFRDKKFDSRDPILTGLTRKAAEGLLSLAALEDFSVDGELLMNLDPEELSLMIGGTELFVASEKQELLEMTDTRIRLEKGIERIGERLRQRRAAKKIEDLLGGSIDFNSLRN